MHFAELRCLPSSAHYCRVTSVRPRALSQGVPAQVHVVTYSTSILSPSFLCASLSLSRTQTTPLPQESVLFIGWLCVGVGGDMAVQFRPARAGSQINIPGPLVTSWFKPDSVLLKTCLCGLTSVISNNSKPSGCFLPSCHKCHTMYLLCVLLDGQDLILVACVSRSSMKCKTTKCLNSGTNSSRSRIR